MDGLRVFMATVDVQETQRLDESVNSSDSVLFVIQLGTGLAEEALVEAEFIETEVLNEIFFMVGDFADVWFVFDGI